MGKKVLVADSEQLPKWFLRNALTQYGHTVDTTSSPWGVRQLMEKGAYDMAFIDMKMLESLDMLPGTPGTPKATKIIICCENLTDALRQEIKERGLLRLEKPVKLMDLRRILEERESGHA